MYNQTHSVFFAEEPLFDSEGHLKRIDENGDEVDAWNTYTDWHLVPTERPDVPSPQANFNLVSIPGVSGSLDLTDITPGGLTFGDRSGEWTFLIENGHEQYFSIVQRILAQLHGKRLICVLQDDPYYYYDGRFLVDPHSGQNMSTIGIRFTLSPYKHYWQEWPNGDWLWDPFNFETDRTDIQVLDVL